MNIARALGLSLLVMPVFAQAEQPVRSTAIITPHESQTQTEPWRMWGLTEHDWQRYQTLKTTPRNQVGPALTPLQLLGISAETDADRWRFAKLHAEASMRRDYRDLLWQATVTAARQELESLEQQLWSEVTITAKRHRKPQHTATEDTEGDIYLFVPMQCTQACAELVARATARPGTTHIFLEGTSGQDELVRNWAARQSIPVQRVKNEQITLNHARDVLARLGHAAKSLPVALMQEGQTFVPAPL